MSEIAPRLLNDTLNLVMLAREAALAEGRQGQAKRLSPVVDGLRSLAAGTPAAASTLQPAATTPASQTGPASKIGPATVGPLANPEFRSLLAAAQSAPLGSGSSATSSVDRGLVASAMSAGGMQEVDIARQLGVSREEVRLMLATNAIGR